jgi:nitrile hydratase beta subunit
MNGAADLGGMHGFGPVGPQDDESVFHADWERRVFALALAMGATGEWTLDASRFARESLPPWRYLAMSYYERWLAALEQQLRDHGVVTAKEVAAGRPELPAKPLRRVLAAADVAGALAHGSPSERHAARPARFAVGERVRARNMHPMTHTRLPGYVRGRAGKVIAVHGCHVYPDSNAHGHGEDPQWLYTVQFVGQELWGEEADPCVTVCVNAFEPYLDTL